MELLSLKLSEFKRFTQPLIVDHLTPGINLFVGPNEAGKSTLVTALRSAFFERYRSSKLEHLQPWHQGNTSPTVELTFTHEGKYYHLYKSFMARKRCVLTIDGTAYENDEAEQRLEALFGFSYAAKGNSKPAQQGIPGLLWIQQGEAQDITAPVSHASDRIRSVLESMLGEVTSSGGDHLIQQVETLRNELVTPATRKPRGEYAETLRLTETLGHDVAELRAQITTYKSHVDELECLHKEIRADEQEDRQGQLSRQYKAAEEKLTVFRQQRDALSAQRSQLEQLKQRHGERTDQLIAFDNEVRDQQQRQATLDKKQVMLEEEKATRKILTQQVHTLKEMLQQNRQYLAVARARQEWHDLQSRQHQLEQNGIRLKQQLTSAEEAQASLKMLQIRLHETLLDEQKVVQLESAQQQHIELNIQLNSQAPLLEYRLQDGKSLTLGNTLLKGQGQQRLLDRETLTLPGLGEITLTPGNSGIDSLVERTQAMKAQVNALLKELDVVSLEAAKAQLDTYRQLERDAFRAKTRLEALAPDGLDALYEQQYQLQRDADKLHQQLADIDTHLFDPTEQNNRVGDSALHPQNDIHINIQSLAQEETSLRIRLEEKNTQLQHANVNVERTSATVQTLQSELDRVRLALESPERHARQHALQASSVQLDADIRIREQNLVALQTQLENIQPELLEQDVERLSQSLQHFLQAQQERRNRQIRLEALLENLGAQGLEEQLAHLIPKEAHAIQRCEQFRQREAALSLLLDRLQEKRQRLIQQLQAPLLEKINHYLRLLFPQAELALDEQLIPQTLKRLQAQGESTGDIEQLSFGAREQLGVISRLAYADLLEASSHPTLLILDDALVNADNERLTQMKRILYDAARRHQILIFSCHPAYWNDLGVEARSMASLAPLEKNI